LDKLQFTTKEGSVTIATIRNTEGCALISRYLRWRGVLWSFSIAREVHTYREAQLRDSIQDGAYREERNQVLKIERERGREREIDKERKLSIVGARLAG